MFRMSQDGYTIRQYCRDAKHDFPLFFSNELLQSQHAARIETLMGSTAHHLSCCLSLDAALLLPHISLTQLGGFLALLTYFLPKGSTCRQQACSCQMGRSCKQVFKSSGVVVPVYTKRRSGVHSVGPDLALHYFLTCVYTQPLQQAG